jgi:hypothetical protein
MERGTPPLAEEPDFAFTIERLIENTDDAYTFPPFATFAPLIEINGRDYASLRAHELELLTASVRGARRSRVRVVGHSWSEIIPTLLDRASGDVPPSVLEVAARSDDDAPARAAATVQAPVPEPPVVGVGGGGRRSSRP